MKGLIHDHFDKIAEVSVLLFIFIFATCMLAAFKGNEEMSRWIENGAVITILARAFGSGRPAPNTVETVSTVSAPTPPISPNPEVKP